MHGDDVGIDLRRVTDEVSGESRLGTIRLGRSFLIVPKLLRNERSIYLKTDLHSAQKMRRSTCSTPSMTGLSIVGYTQTRSVVLQHWRC